MATLGRRIGQALDWKGWIPANLVEAGVGNSGMVSKWLNDKAQPSADQLAGLCRALGISGHWLLLDEGPMQAPGEEVLGPFRQARLAADVEVSARVREALDLALGATAKSPARHELGAAAKGASDSAEGAEKGRKRGKGRR